MTEYAVRVPKEETEAVMRKAEKEGVYDDARSVKKSETAGEEKTEIPVTGEVTLDGYDAFEQESPEYRKTSLEDLTDVEDPPSSWKTVGDVVLVNLGGYTSEEKTEIGESLLELTSARTVLDYRGVSGEMRKPDVGLVAGDEETETLHRENGFEFRLDPAEVMFSVGNAEERLRMRETVGEGETVFDMFAGIGYFSVPAAVGGAEVVAAEINPVSCSYLEENARLNGVESRIEAYNENCLDVAPDREIDRVLMGHFDAVSEEFMRHAVSSVDGKGVLHVHDAAYDPAETEEEIRRLVEDRGLGASVETRRIKGYSEGVSHYVFDVEVGV
ncbi:MAG: class I SAM-dependent methyltransferase family protein [Halobacteria archaeon]|nr:class I SAM-dependent methyltransferase family protein [Halobacteria archaeon]